MTPLQREPLDVTWAVAHLRTMIRIRVFEQTVEQLFLAGKLPGFVHTYLGEEAVAAGVCGCLAEDDYVTSTHRGHGHAIAKGVDLAPLMAELYGKATGTCKGRGGSMHVADFSKGMLGANGIVAGGSVIAAGAGLSIQLRGTQQVAVAFFGDGGINKGTVHEAMNFTALRRLPVIFVCENNQYAQFTNRGRTTSVEDLSERAIAYAMPGVNVDGNDLVAVSRATTEALVRARGGQGPSLIVANTYRFGGHYVGDAEVYRDRTEVDERRANDPISRFEASIDEQGLSGTIGVQRIWEEVESEVKAAVEFAESSADPDPSTALSYVFAAEDGSSP